MVLTEIRKKIAKCPKLPPVTKIPIGGILVQKNRTTYTNIHTYKNVKRKSKNFKKQDSFEGSSTELMTTKLWYRIHAAVAETAVELDSHSTVYSVA